MKRDLFAPEQEEFRLLIRDFIAREVVPYRGEWEEEGRIPREFFRKLGEIGVMGSTRSGSPHGAHPGIIA
jgi:acyl-CoA dehydrogenase